MLARSVAWSLLAFGCGPKAGGTTAPAPTPAPEATADNASATEEPARPELAPATNLYRADFGEGEPTLVFLHGGPGYNSALFEATTAEVLAADYRVVVYDRRGTARSPDPSSEIDAYTFAQAVVDLEGVLGDAKAPILLGHSFGGAVALAYLDEHPDFEGQVVLVNAPVSYPGSLSTILANCRKVYEAKGDDESLASLDAVAQMDTTTAPYANFTFMHGMTCGLYRPSAPTTAARTILGDAAKHPVADFFSASSPGPVMGFIANEHYTTRDLTAAIERHAPKVWAIYGDEDRIISPNDRAMLQELLGQRYIEIEGAAHNVFVDQRASFVKAVREIASSRPE